MLNKLRKRVIITRLCIISNNVARLRFEEQRFQCFVNEFSRSPVFPGCGLVFNQFTGFAIFRDSRLRVEYSCSGKNITTFLSSCTACVCFLCFCVLLLFLHFTFLRVVLFYFLLNTFNMFFYFIHL